MILTEAQIDIIQEVCLIELENLDGIRDRFNSDDPTDEIANLLKYDGHSMIYDQLEKLYNTFSDLYRRPRNLFSLGENEIMIFRHILFNYEDNFIDRPNALSNLWNKFFISEKINSTQIMN